jgi:hypothetical protein
MRLFTRERNEIDPSSAIFFFFTRRNAHTYNPVGCVLYVRIDVPAAALIFFLFILFSKKPLD